MRKSKPDPGQPLDCSLGEEKRTELFSQFYTLTWAAEVENSVSAQRQIEQLCAQYPFLAEERAQKVKQHQRTQVVLAQRARRGEPLFPVKVIKANGRLRKFGITLPLGRAPRQATNARRRGSCRTAAPTRAGPDDSGDGDPDGDHHPLGRQGQSGEGR